MKSLSDTIVMTMEPAEPFLEWVTALGTHLKNRPPEQDDLINTEDLTAITAVLITDKPDLTQFHTYLMSHSASLLRYEFSRWTYDETLWPARNDAEILLEFFHIDVYDSVIDLRKSRGYGQVAILNPTAALRTWLSDILRVHDIESENLNLEHPEAFQFVSTAYLLPEDIVSTEDAVKYFRNHYSDFFETELNRYITDEKYWPKKRDINVFWEWFKLSLYPKPYIL